MVRVHSSKFASRLYPLRSAGARRRAAQPARGRAVALALCLGVVCGGLFGCSTPIKPVEDGISNEQVSKMSTMDRLFLAMKREVQARGWPIDTASRRFRVVTTQYEQLSPRLRKRRVLRIVVLPRGGALRVLVQHERDVGAEGQPEWGPVRDPKLREDARREEVVLGRAVERRFHALR